jgi:hypothetical protein
MSHPYEALPPEAFWRSAVAEAERVEGLWVPKFPVTATHRIATFGSCFARHIGQALVARGFRWLDAEPAPAVFTDAATNFRFNYGVYSARTGNIYTARAFRQWVEWALGDSAPPEEAWEEGGRFFDPFRPAIEPGGFGSQAEMLGSRAATLAALRRVFETADRLVLTLGLTEAWEDTATGLVLPVCPGVIAGRFDPARHVLRNFGFEAVQADLAAIVRAVWARNRTLRLILTVSPVPLTATATGQHVLVATTGAKAVLRAAAGALAEARQIVDYFPAWEIVAAGPGRDRYYAANRRSVTPEGVAAVMAEFFAGLAARFGASPTAGVAEPETIAGGAEPVCEEVLLDAARRP